MTPLLRVRIMARLAVIQACWEPARMQASGLSFALEPWLVRCWAGDAEGLREARLRHLSYFNTHPCAAWLVAGALCESEARAARLSGAERAAVLARQASLKKSTAAALSGLFDSLFWGSLRPASAVLGVLVFVGAAYARISQPAALGAGAALLSYALPSLYARARGFAHGFARGEAAFGDMTRLPLPSWIRGLRRAAAVGALAAAVPAALLLPGPVPRARAAVVFAAGLAMAAGGVDPLKACALVGGAGALAFSAGIRG